MSSYHFSNQFWWRLSAFLHLNDVTLKTDKNRLLIKITNFHNVSLRSRRCLEVMGAGKNGSLARETRKGRGSSLSPRVSPSRAPFFLAPITPKRRLCRLSWCKRGQLVSKTSCLESECGWFQEENLQGGLFKDLVQLTCECKAGGERMLFLVNRIFITNKGIQQKLSRQQLENLIRCKKFRTSNFH